MRRALLSLALVVGALGLPGCGLLGGGGSYQVTAYFDRAVSVFPSGDVRVLGLPAGSIAEVEIDPATGEVDVVRYIVCDDVGHAINPLIVRGQVHGGVAQGIGQAVLEHTVYDPASGQLVSGTFMDYGIPRADDLPDIDVDLIEIPCETNPLGVKGAGEAGAVGSPPAVVNAIVDALAEDGVRHVDMPATPERLWRTIAAAKAA